MWLRASTPQSRAAWLTSLDAIAAIEACTIIMGHRDPAALDDDAGRLLDQSRRYIEDFEQALHRVPVQDSTAARHDYPPVSFTTELICTSIAPGTGSTTITNTSTNRTCKFRSHRRGYTHTPIGGDRVPVDLRSVAQVTHEDAAVTTKTLPVVLDDRPSP